MGLLKGWLKKHRGLGKRHLAFYVKSFRFVHDHRRCGIDGRFVAALAMAPDQFEDRQARPQGDCPDDIRLAAMFSQIRAGAAAA